MNLVKSGHHTPQKHRITKLSQTEIVAGRHVGRHTVPLLCHVVQIPVPGDQHGAAAGAASWGSGASRARVQDASGHQNQTGDGDCRVQKTSGWRGYKVRQQLQYTIS